MIVARELLIAILDNLYYGSFAAHYSFSGFALEVIIRPLIQGDNSAYFPVLPNLTTWVSRLYKRSVSQIIMISSQIFWSTNF